MSFTPTKIRGIFGYIFTIEKRRGKWYTEYRKKFKTMEEKYAYLFDQIQSHSCI